MKRIIPLAFEVMYSQLKSYIPENSDDYSRSTREWHRIFTLIIEREKDDTMQKKWQEIRDIFCLIWEKDLAYRLRGQDGISELNLEEIKLDDGDKEFALQNKSYRWGFIK
jgi:EAL domain-containing protein (putative c-di-GMP-specific phosphodiesterase class I)